MIKFKKQLILNLSLLALIISITACEPGNTQAQKAPGINNCNQLEKYKGSNRLVAIRVDMNGDITIDDGGIDEYFWHKDTIVWEIVDTPWLRDKKGKKQGKDKSITDFQVHFYEHNANGQCDTEDDAPKLWPCEETGGEWTNGQSKLKKSNQKITCKIREDALSKFPSTEHKYPNPASLDKWNYCYTVTVTTPTGDETFYSEPRSQYSRPSGGGNGCGSCHAGSGF